MISYPFILIGIVVSVLYMYYTIRYRMKLEKTVVCMHKQPRVSILIPMRNVDDEIAGNLESIFLLDYRKKEIFFAVDSLRDPVVPILKRILKKYSSVKARIIATGHSTVENPKVFKLAALEKFCSGSLYWVVDSNVRVSSDVLIRLVNEYLENDSKIVFSPIQGAGGETFGSLIENAYLNYFMSGNIIAAWKLFKQQIIVGKSMLIEARTLKYFGGFSYFKEYLAEDFILGKTYTNSRFPISTNFTWVTNVNRYSTVSDFLSRMIRWAKLRFHLNWKLYFLEIFTNPVVIALLSFLVIGLSSIWILFGTLLFKICLEFTNFLVLNPEDSRKTKNLFLFPLAVILKDLLLFYVFFTPFFSNTIKWRGGEIRIGPQTVIDHNRVELLIKGA